MSSTAQLTMHETMEFRSGKVVAIGSTDRVKRLSAQFHAARPSICLNGIEAYTKVYQ